MIKKLLLIILFSIFLTLITQKARAEQSETELAKQTQNPIANLISLPFQNNFDINVQPYDRTRVTTNIQPVIPIDLNEKYNLITRTILPVIRQPVGQNDDEYGLGDTSFSLFFVPKESKILWGAGPIFLLPTSTDRALGVGEPGIGPTLVALQMKKQWVYGFVTSQVWTDTNSHGNKFNFFTFQYFINYNFGKGWYFSSAPINTANWEQDTGEEWTVPVGGGFGKVFRIGNQPINISLTGYKNIEHPANGAEYQIRFQFQFLFPKGGK
jgi:hypothetical protein